MLETPFMFLVWQSIPSNVIAKWTVKLRQQLQRFNTTTRQSLCVMVVSRHRRHAVRCESATAGHAAPDFREAQLGSAEQVRECCVTYS
jgi:hypothetical protein